MSAVYWRGLEGLDGSWWETGNAEFDGLRYLGIQVHARDLDLHLGTSNGVAAARYSEHEMRDWMAEHRHLDMDTAFHEFRADPRYNGTKQEPFRAEWRTVIGRKRGRPARNS